VVLAIDVSPSMGADDVEPTRFDAVTAAARSFVEQAPEHVRLGLVVFAGTAKVQVAPTLDRAPVLRSIEGLKLAEGTAIGEAIFSGLDALAADRPEQECDGDEPCGDDRDSGGQPRRADSPPAELIVVMSDGETTMGRPNEQGAAAAQEVGVPVTVAFGTAEGVITIDGQTSAVPVSPEPLREIAETTGGEFYETATEEGLADAFTDLGRQESSETEDGEIGYYFVWLGGGPTVLAALASLLWFSHLPCRFAVTVGPIVVGIAAIGSRAGPPSRFDPRPPRLRLTKVARRTLGQVYYPRAYADRETARTVRVRCRRGGLQVARRPDPAADHLGVAARRALGQRPRRPRRSAPVGGFPAPVKASPRAAGAGAPRGQPGLLRTHQRAHRTGGRRGAAAR
jgi:Ca-activated chloride channel family protein